MTAVDNRTEAVSGLLSETEAAHGVYETTELNGVYDQDWPHWYATYAVEHGIGDQLGHAVTADRLAEFLAGTFDEFKAAEPRPTEPWVTWTARRIASEL
jgi:hypothetical protein